MEFTREEISKHFRESLTADDGIGSSLENPRVLDSEYEDWIQVDGGAIDVAHLTSDTIHMINEYVGKVLHEIADNYNRRNQEARNIPNIADLPQTLAVANAYERVYADLHVLANKYQNQKGTIQ